jgi:hypothetical protein
MDGLSALTELASAPFDVSVQDCLALLSLIFYSFCQQGITTIYKVAAAGWPFNRSPFSCCCFFLSFNNFICFFYASLLDLGSLPGSRL